MWAADLHHGSIERLPQRFFRRDGHGALSAPVDAAGCCCCLAACSTLGTKRRARYSANLRAAGETSCDERKLEGAPASAPVLFVISLSWCVFQEGCSAHSQIRWCPHDLRGAEEAVVVVRRCRGAVLLVGQRLCGATVTGSTQLQSDESTCRNLGAQPGTDVYVQCRLVTADAAGRGRSMRRVRRWSARCAHCSRSARHHQAQLAPGGPPLAAGATPLVAGVLQKNRMMGFHASHRQPRALIPVAALAVADPRRWGHGRNTG